MHSSHSICIYITYIYMSNPQQNNCTQNQSLRASAPLQAGPEICLTISTLMDPSQQSWRMFTTFSGHSIFERRNAQASASQIRPYWFPEGSMVTAALVTAPSEEVRKNWFCFFSNSSHHLESISPIGIRPQPENSLIFRPLPYITYISRMSHQDDIVAR